MDNGQIVSSSIATSTEKEDMLSRQYGGVHVGRWVDRLPPYWIPYVQLARLSPPIAMVLIYLPHVFGILHAAILSRRGFWEVIGISAKLLGGSLFFSNAAHAWNDLIDAPIDRCVSRTKNRPIARGAISPTAACVFTASQAALAASFLLLLPRATVIATIPTIIGTVYYPWAKKHTYFPQVVLGFCLAWGIIVGCAAMGAKDPWKERTSLCLVLVSALWTIIFDTIYAYQDVEEDIKIGVGSTAALFRHHTKIFLWLCLAMMGSCIAAYGRLASYGLGFYIVSLGGCLLSLGTMIARVNLSDQGDCWWWFMSNFWVTAASLVGGLLLEYVLRCYG